MRMSSRKSKHRRLLTSGLALENKGCIVLGPVRGIAACLRIIPWQSLPRFVLNRFPIGAYQQRWTPRLHLLLQYVEEASSQAMEYGLLLQPYAQTDENDNAWKLGIDNLGSDLQVHRYC